jgi:hypothetical protein
MMAQGAGSYILTEDDVKSLKIPKGTAYPSGTPEFTPGF